MSRARHCWLVITGRIDFDYSTERMEFFMALEKTVVAVANLKSAASAMLAHCQDHSAEIAQFQQQLAAVDVADASVSADIQATADQLNSAANPPVA